MDLPDGGAVTQRGTPSQAIPILRESIGRWEVLVERAGGQPWEKLVSAPDHARAATELGNLAATMGDLAAALTGLASTTRPLLWRRRDQGFNKHGAINAKSPTATSDAPISS